MKNRCSYNFSILFVVCLVFFSIACNDVKETSAIEVTEYIPETFKVNTTDTLQFHVEALQYIGQFILEIDDDDSISWISSVDFRKNPAGHDNKDPEDLKDTLKVIDLKIPYKPANAGTKSCNLIIRLNADLSVEEEFDYTLNVVE